MPDFIMTFFSVELVASLLIALVIGILLLTRQKVSDKARKVFGIILLSLALFNFLFFNIFMSRRFSYQLGEFLSLILLFAITFIEGLILVVTHEIKKGLKNFFGVLLVLLFIFWAVTMVLTI